MFAELKLTWARSQCSVQCEVNVWKCPEIMHVDSDTTLKVWLQHICPKLTSMLCFQLNERRVCLSLLAIVIFQGASVNALHYRFSNTDCIDLLPRLTQRIQRRAGNPLERANESALLQRESWHWPEASGEEVLVVKSEAAGECGRCGFPRCSFTSAVHPGCHMVCPTSVLCWLHFNTTVELSFIQSIQSSLISFFIIPSKKSIFYSEIIHQPVHPCHFHPPLFFFSVTICYECRYSASDKHIDIHR